MRRLLLVLSLSAAMAVLAALATLASPAAAQPKTKVDGQVNAAATYFEYACNPSATAWALKGAWGSGTVLEARTCLREWDNGNVDTILYARTRRGGTPILSDWNLTEAFGRIHSYTTGFDYGYRDNWGDAFDTSIVRVQTYQDCSQVAGVDDYIGSVNGWTANPNGTTDGVSGVKSQPSAAQQNSGLDCGRQLW